MSVLVGSQAPDFTSAAVLSSGEIVEEFNLYSKTKGKYALVFFYPLDFTFVCPSELIALDNVIVDFEARNVSVVAVSIDSHFTHNAWRNTAIADGGIGPVRYPLIADTKHDICKAYHVEHPKAGVALRGAFLIDTNHVVRAQMVNDLPIGRSMVEILRLFDAIQYTEKNGEVCPANWEVGKPAMQASPEGVSAYLKEHAKDLESAE